MKQKAIPRPEILGCVQMCADVTEEERLKHFTKQTEIKSGPSDLSISRKKH